MPWITTKSGKHINTDWFEKDKQIENNRKVAEELNKSSSVGAEWLDFAGSYGKDWTPNIDTKQRAMEWIQQLKNVGVVDKNVSNEDAQRYFTHYGDYAIDEYENAPYGKLAEGFTKYTQGANERGYGKEGRRVFDQKYGLSKFIDSHKEMQLDTDISMYRGVRTNQKELELLQMAYKGKSEIGMKGISSWSANSHMADRFTKGTLDASGDIRLIYKDVTKGQRPAMPWPHSGQHEAIYSSSARWNIISMKQTSWGWEVEVEMKKGR